jgi:hypothetical protein
MTSPVKFNKNGNLAKLVKKLQSLHRQKVSVGYFKEQPWHSEADMSYAELMQLHEYADSDSPWPRREVLNPLARGMSARKGTFKINLSKYLVRFIREDSFDRDKLFDYIGQWAVHESYKIFGNPAYLIVKSNPTPLVDTGELRDNFAWKVSFRGTVHTL